MEYCKVMSESEHHFGFRFKDGLNIDNVPFSEEDFTGGGFYSTDFDNVHDHIGIHGSENPHIRRVEFPYDMPGFRLVNPRKGVWKSNAIILGEKIPLDLDSCIKYGISYFPEEREDEASERFSEFNREGQLALVRLACKHGDVDKLELYKKRDRFALSGFCVDNCDSVEVLHWWKNSGIKFEYTTYALRRCNTKVLKWWINTGLELKVPPNPTFPNIKKLLAWNRAWKRGEISVRALPENSRSMLIKASEQGTYSQLQEYVDSGFKVPKKKGPLIMAASKRGNIEALNFWYHQYKNKGQGFYFTSKVIPNSSLYNILDVLKWWKNKIQKRKAFLNIKCSVIDEFVERSDWPLLRWWRDSGLEFVFSERSFTAIIRRRDKAMAKWWVENGLYIDLPPNKNHLTPLFKEIREEVGGIRDVLRLQKATDDLFEKARKLGREDVIHDFIDATARGVPLEMPRQVHILEPYWHTVPIKQIIGRATRVVSHNNLSYID